MSPEALGTFATITSLVFMALGLPVQIYKIYHAKSTKGVSLFTQCTLFLTTMAWCVYSLKISNGYILVANAPGALFALIILCQFWFYRHGDKTQNHIGFLISKQEMMTFLTTGGVCLKNQPMIGPPYIGKKMELTSENGITRTGEVSNWEALPEDYKFNITFKSC